MSDEIVKHGVSVVSRGQAGANTRYHRFEKVIEQPAEDNTVFINPDIVQAYDPDRYESWRVLHWGGGWDSSYISVAWMVPARAQSAHLTDRQTDTPTLRGSVGRDLVHTREVTAGSLLLPRSSRTRWDSQWDPSLDNMVNYFCLHFHWRVVALWMVGEGGRVD